MSAEILYFTADWCGPCRSMRPILSELQAEGVKVTMVDVDKERATANQFGVMAMPTFFIMKNGSPIKRLVGARTKLSILSELWSADNE